MKICIMLIAVIVSAASSSFGLSIGNKVRLVSSDPKVSLLKNSDGCEAYVDQVGEITEVHGDVLVTIDFDTCKMEFTNLGSEGWFLVGGALVRDGESFSIKFLPPTYVCK